MAPFHLSPSIVSELNGRRRNKQRINPRWHPWCGFVKETDRMSVEKLFRKWWDEWNDTPLVHLRYWFRVCIQLCCLTFFFFFIVFFLLCSAIKMHGRVQKKHNNSQMFLLCCVLKIAQEHSRYLYLYCARWQGCFKVENSQDKNKKIEFNSCTCVIYIWVE